MEWKFFLSIRGENAHTIEYLINCLYDSSATFHSRIVSCEYIATFFCPKRLLSHAEICLGTFLLPSRYFFLSLPTILAAIKGDFLVLLLSDHSSLVRTDQKNDTEQQISQRNRLSLLHFLVILFSRLHGGGSISAWGDGGGGGGGGRRWKARGKLSSSLLLLGSGLYFLFLASVDSFLLLLRRRNTSQAFPGNIGGEKTQHNARGKEEGKADSFLNDPRGEKDFFLAPSRAVNSFGESSIIAL